ncbi:MAG: hypothetical protein IKJ43_02730 [Bacilli bacterium]|nr:hypothetical protein [Bacilli bacterium]
MKIKNCVLLLLLVIIPLNVKANIMCNDGTESPTCTDCHRGCCSWHGGCRTYSNNHYYQNNNNDEYYEEDEEDSNIEETNEESNTEEVNNELTETEKITITAALSIAIFVGMGTIHSAITK